MLKLNSIPASFYLLSGRIMIGIGQLLMIRLLTFILDSGEIGKYYLLMSVVSGISLFLINPVSVYIQRHLYGWNTKGLARIAIDKLVIFLAVMGIVTLGILYSLKNFNLIDLNIFLKTFVVVIPLLIIVTRLTRLFPTLCNLLGKYKIFVILSNLDLWGKMVVIYLFAFFFSNSVETVLWAIIFWGGLFVLISSRYLYRFLKKPQNGNNPFKLNTTKDVFSFSWPLVLTSGLYWGQSEGYRFILHNTAGVNIVGKFVVAYSLGAALMIAIDDLFHRLYLPVFYKEISAETVESHIAAWNKYAKNVMSVCIPVGMYIACAGPFLARWLVHASYRDIGIYAAFGVISQLLRIFSASFYYGIVARKNTSLLILPGVIGTTIALTGTFVLSSEFPILGTGISLIFSHLIVSVGSYFQLKRKIAVQIPWPSIGEAILLSLPLSFILFMGYKLGWHNITILNVVILIITGMGMLYIQWRLSKDVWFQRESELDIVKVS